MRERKRADARLRRLTHVPKYPYVDQTKNHILEVFLNKKREKYSNLCYVTFYFAYSHVKVKGKLRVCSLDNPGILSVNLAFQLQSSQFHIASMDYASSRMHKHVYSYRRAANSLCGAKSLLSRETRSWSPRIPKIIKYIRLLFEEYILHDKSHLIKVQRTV